MPGLTEDIIWPARILVIADDPKPTQTVVDYLCENSLCAMLTNGRHELIRRLAENEPNLVLLDLRHGTGDGLGLLREIRSRSDVPVIIISGSGSDEIDLVVGLELGADDYVAQSFTLGELLARIRAVLRRPRDVPVEALPDAKRVLCRFNGWELNSLTRRLTNPHGNRVNLTKGEYTILIAFLNAPQRPLTREQLLQATLVDEETFIRTIDVQVMRLRRKLEIKPGSPRVIQTEWGVGYVFAPLVQWL